MHTTADSKLSTMPSNWDGTALGFLEGYVQKRPYHVNKNWPEQFVDTTRKISDALKANRSAEVHELIWTKNNGISNLTANARLKGKTINSLLSSLRHLTQEIYQDGSPENHLRIESLFQSWFASEQLEHRAPLLRNRAFAAIHPDRYHTTVKEVAHNAVVKWFANHTSFVAPASSNWAHQANALVKYLDQSYRFASLFDRNSFPWYVWEQLDSQYAQVNALEIGKTNLPDMAGFKPLELAAMRSASIQDRPMALRHGMLAEALSQILHNDFGAGNYEFEYKSGTGGRVDAVARISGDRFNIYEIKVAATAHAVIREAIGQLLEYSYRDGGVEPVKLFAVGEHPIDEVSVRYLERLRTQFGIPIDYLSVNLSVEQNSRLSKALIDLAETGSAANR
ncbi:hypothetical protein [Pigmentiphaga litoralis]|uniref:hypothetical protein n=1 Tax=Pigmentiphaga litoralis TaxID=516702 RepID=UPI003B430075